MISCIFDPADRVLSLKVPLFAACWAVTLAQCSFRRERCRLPLELIVYTLLFVAIPSASIVGYYVTGGGQPYDGFQLLKGYVLVSLGALLYLNRIDVLPHLAAVLTALAALILGVAIAVTVEPTLYDLLYLPGSLSGLLFLDRRDYAGLVMLQVYFVTSPMLVISIAYYFHLAKTHASRRRRMLYAGLSAMSIVAMFFAGTRNNIIVSLLLPLALVLLYSRSRLNGVLISAGATAVLGGDVPRGDRPAVRPDRGLQFHQALAAAGLRRHPVAAADAAGGQRPRRLAVLGSQGRKLLHQRAHVPRDGAQFRPVRRVADAGAAGLPGGARLRHATLPRREAPGDRLGVLPADVRLEPQSLLFDGNPDLVHSAGESVPPRSRFGRVRVPHDAIQRLHACPQWLAIRQGKRGEHPRPVLPGTRACTFSTTRAAIAHSNG